MEYGCHYSGLVCTITDNSTEILHVHSMYVVESHGMDEDLRMTNETSHVRVFIASLCSTWIL